MVDPSLKEDLSDWEAVLRARLPVSVLVERDHGGQGCAIRVTLTAPCHNEMFIFDYSPDSNLPRPAEQTMPPPYPG